MSEMPAVVSERVDDIPLLLAQMERMQIASLLDEQIRPHGNWQGLSHGHLAVVWLTFILSQANHRLSHLEPWVEQRLLTLRALVNDHLRSLDFTDDRLACLLDALADDEAWAGFEAALGQRTIRAYDLSCERVRLDSTTSFGYRDVDEDGLFQFGHSKDHRPDLPQLKVNLSALDPLGLPLTSTVVEGGAADDTLYVPEIERVRHLLGRHGITFIGDTKMAAIGIRTAIAAHGDFYLCPLPALQMPQAHLDALLDRLEAEDVRIKSVRRPVDQKGERELLAEGFETHIELSAELEYGRVAWRERRLVVRSLALERRERKALEERVEATKAAVLALGRRRKGKNALTLEETRRRAREAIRKAKLVGVIEPRVEAQTHRRKVRGYAGKEGRVEEVVTLDVSIRVDEQALERTRRRVGWRVYATNAKVEQVGLEEAVLAYRAAHRIEHDFARLKGKPLALRPIYLERDERVKGLVRLLTIGLRVLTLVEFVARRSLAEGGEALAGLYAGNARRATMRPSAEILLRAFTELTLVVMTHGATRLVHLSPLSAPQQRILQVLGLPDDLFDRLRCRISEIPFGMSGP